jgi:hypothetical protein
MQAVCEKIVWMSCDNEKIVHLQCRFGGRHREDRFSDEALIRQSLVNFKNQSVSLEMRFNPIGRGLLFAYPLIKVYQSLPNGMG